MRGQRGGLPEITEFEYRKTFGLSQAEMDDEPIDKFVLNSQIMAIINKLQDEAERRAKRKR